MERALIKGKRIKQHPLILRLVSTRRHIDSRGRSSRLYRIISAASALAELASTAARCVCRHAMTWRWLSLQSGVRSMQNTESLRNKWSKNFDESWHRVHASRAPPGGWVHSAAPCCSGRLLLTQSSTFRWRNSPQNCPLPWGIQAPT